MEKQLKLGSLFDGSGGFPLGGILAGIRPIWNSEIEPFPIRVTTKRLPFVKHYGDINNLIISRIKISILQMLRVTNQKHTPLLAAAQAVVVQVEVQVVARPRPLLLNQPLLPNQPLLLNRLLPQRQLLTLRQRTKYPQLFGVVNMVGVRETRELRSSLRYSVLIMASKPWYQKVLVRVPTLVQPTHT